MCSGNICVFEVFLCVLAQCLASRGRLDRGEVWLAAPGWMWHVEIVYVLRSLLLRI